MHLISIHEKYIHVYMAFFDKIIFLINFQNYIFDFSSTATGVYIPVKKVTLRCFPIEHSGCTDFKMHELHGVVTGLKKKMKAILVIK